MATLKFRTAHGMAWICDVQSVQIGASWVVPHQEFDRPDRSQPLSVFGAFNTLIHEIPAGEYDSRQPTTTDLASSTDPPARVEWAAVELLVGRKHEPAQTGERYEVHIVSAGECWLMGDDGRTIDRIP